MKTNSLAAFTRKAGYVPLAWAGSTMSMNYLNIGDALSPIMVALLSGLDVRRVPTKAQSLRMGCVGTIGHGFAGGEVYFWGTGSSPWSNPSAPMEQRKLFEVPPESNFIVTATRGPLSESLLTGRDEGTVGIYGDPVWLLPRFYKPSVSKKWKIGVIVHLSELIGRETEAHLKPELLRYLVPEEMRGEVHIINTVSAINVKSIQAKIDEILACERIVSTSLHGMVFAESYGIPCLPFPTGGAATGLGQRDLMDERTGLDLRFVDLYRGLRMSTLSVYTQPTHQMTDWAQLMRAVDDAWQPKHLDEHALIEAFPLEIDPVSAASGQTIWDHPLLAGLVLQHEVKELNRLSKTATAK